MKVSLKWLRDYVDVDLPPGEVARRLTMAGLEVKSTELIGGSWYNVFVGQIREVNPHPNADRLRLATVDLGTELLTVVCGAPNLRLGDKVPFARVGAELYDGHTGVKSLLKPAKIRGVVSAGMACSEKELGISDDHKGLMILPADAPLGMPLADYLGDAIFNLEITPNRPDCLSVIGIAREVAALTGKKVRMPDDSYSEADPPIEGQISVEIEAPDLCPRYCATLIKGVRIGESPTWMQQRLIAGGMRPINNIVDITNFVMLEHGQPLHSFDYSLIRGKKIIVRRARPGEKMTTLDNVERELAPNTLVIADNDRAVAVAGVMGGVNTEVEETTTSILLEAASFNPTSIHYTARTLAMPSEASNRFERGIRSELTISALKRATRLIKELAGGEVARGTVDVFPGRKDEQPVAVSTVQVKRLLGVEFSRERIVETLTSLGFECRVGSGPGDLTATSPYWRSDVRLAEDLIEEVARIEGYDRIPDTLLAEAIPRQDPVAMLGLKQRVRDALVGYGFDEVVTSTLVGVEALKRLTPDGRETEALRLVNPMTAEQEYLRPTLRAHLLTALASNQRFAEGALRLVELSKVYMLRASELPDERETVCAVISGPRVDKWWQGGDEGSDFFFGKGVVEGILRNLNVVVTFEPGTDPSLRPNSQAAIRAGDKRLGIVGEIHPKVRENFEISGTAYLLELDLPELLPLAGTDRTYKAIPRFPAVTRDIALVVDAQVTNRQVADIVCGFPLVDSLSLFDVYAGEQVPQGKKSLAYRLTFLSPTKTLTDEAANSILQQIIDKLAKELGATLRS
jgi:phenylalanyl-tRNA synthetase beta chain